MFGNQPKPVRVLAGVIAIMMALLPFHAVLSTWAISNFGHDMLFKAWKELLLFFVAVPIATWLVYKDKKVARDIVSNRINQLIIAFVVLNILLVLLHGNSAKTEIAGLLFNLRFFAMFIVAQVLALAVAKEQLREVLLRVIFWGGLLVVTFGALQVLVLPHDILRHVGYQKSIIPPYFTIDNNQQYVRILSTLRGPNALGAYLVFWLPFLALVTRRMWSVAVKYRIYAAIIWAMSLITLFGSRSRSAWLGAFVAAGFLAMMQASSAWRKRIALAGITVGVIAVAGIALNWNSTFIQTTLRHRDPTESSNVDSDGQHQSSLTSALKTVQSHPFGTGVGSVNIASTYGTKPVTVESYYLQVAVELGVVGVTLFMAILVLIALKLWELRRNDIAAALLAGFVGLLVVNLLLPAWGDETLSMLWWGMAGLIFFAKNTHKAQ